jgi:DNA-binding transcriptional regulator GbsR (MarR family)
MATDARHPAPDEAERIRRDFASGWGKIGAAWGVTPSTAAVQGYLLAHGGPLTKSELQAALGLSHRATLLALAECRSWGLIEPASERRRAGRRGPTAIAWVPIGDHWEWFRRVAAARKERETDPVLPLLDECLGRAQAGGAAQLEGRLVSLLEFIHEFDRGVDIIVGSQAATIEHLFGVIGKADRAALARLLKALVAIPEEDLAKAVESLASMRPALLRRFIGLARQPTIARLLGGRPGL